MAEPNQRSCADANGAQCGADPPAGAPGRTIVLSSEHGLTQGLPQPGEQLGHYRIIRALGGGGMGTVFEAEDLDTGRRIALKLLSHSLDSPDARQRFLREGRLAASINHPNSVYVFGTEELGGNPVIAMELVPGGTLDDRIRSQGPSPPAEAVDAVLQIIAGLEAAHRVGILHRDIKPSNCFIDLDGTVKIGDFGLSFSTAICSEPSLTVTGAFLGTPAFASPEQLRGQDLTLRSDIYSLGATLFYLLTGRTPFHAKNVVALIASVFEHSAPSPKDFSPQVPAGLSKVVRRCLQKQPDQRFKDYAELRQALTPYGSAAPQPASLGRRFLAGLLDLALVSLPSLAVLLPDAGIPVDWLNQPGQRSWNWLALSFASIGGSVLYFALLEGFCGATIGKGLCRLRVTGTDNNAPGFWRALLRALIYVVVPTLPTMVFAIGFPPAFYRNSRVFHFPIEGLFYLVLALLFCPARRRNGFAGLQDLLSKTRVTSRVALSACPPPPAAEPPPPTTENWAVVGPFHVPTTLEPSANEIWRLGYDPLLSRRVWIRLVAPGTPPLPAPRRNLNRAARLRWLTGRRSASENWDAFEAAPGTPLTCLIEDPQPWAEVRYWLYDLAREISAAEKDGTLPPVLALDRVWIGLDGRAKLLDFAAPEFNSPPLSSALVSDKFRGSPSPVPGKQSAEHFLAEVAAAALAARPEAATKSALPLPLHARAFLKTLPRFTNPDACALALKPLLSRPAIVTRSRRAAVLGGCVALPMFAGCMVALLFPMLQLWNRDKIVELSYVLSLRSNSRLKSLVQYLPDDKPFAVYIASQYRNIITNQTSWSSLPSVSLIKGEARQFAMQSVAMYPMPTEEEAAQAKAALAPYLPRPDAFYLPKQLSFPLLQARKVLMFFVWLPALLAALIFRGGLILRIAGVAFIGPNGLPASRLRLFWRALLAWSPAGLGMLLLMAIAPLHSLVFEGLVFGLAGALAVLSVVSPKRGLQDRLAGTWPVPR